MLYCPADVGAPPDRIVHRNDSKLDLGFRAGEFQDQLRQRQDGTLAGTAQVDRSGDPIGVHELLQPVHHVGDETEGAGLGAVSVDGQGLSPQRLDHEVADDAPVHLRHAGPVGVEDAGDPHVDAVLAPVIDHQGFGHPFPLVVAASRADGIHVAPVVLPLGMDQGVSVDLGSAGLEDPGPDPLGQAQKVEGAHDVGLHRLDRVVLVVHRRRRRGQVVDPVHLQQDRLGHVVADELEVRVFREREDVAPAAREQVVQAEHVRALPEQRFAEVAADESGAPRYQYPFPDHPVPSGRMGMDGSAIRRPRGKS